MKIFDKRVRRGAAVVSGHADPQIRPLDVALDDGSPGCLKIDRAVLIGTWQLVAGWSSGPVELALRTHGDASGNAIFSTDRSDVAVHLGIASGEGLGFVLAAPSAEPSAEVLCGKEGQQISLGLRIESPWTPLDPNALTLLMPALRWLARTLPPFSPDWIEVVRSLPVSDASGAEVRGMLEQATANGRVRRGLASGWVVAPEAAIVWLQDSEGGVHGLDVAARMYREDVHAALAADMRGSSSAQPGFHLRLAGLAPGSMLSLRALLGDVIHLVAEIPVTALPDHPAAAARHLFENRTATSAGERIATVDTPVLDALITADRQSWKTLPVRIQDVGRALGEPKASIIVPLYGRADFVEHQFMEFDRDPWLKRNAELVYVLDDRALVDRFASEAQALHRLYGIPFRWIWGSANRGFAGASNLGARHSTAPVLLFMNSDVFPQEPGWLPPLLDVLQQRRDIGIVAPRLLFSDGSIQHAGMRFLRREELGVWINDHPSAGLDPLLDPHSELGIVPAVTGACVAIRRGEFDAVDGWDDGYLIGDFEDSDLCLKLRRKGLKSAYLPSVQLTHLERQSFRLIEQDAFRTQVFLYNALRHQHRWHDVLEDIYSQQRPDSEGRRVTA